MRTDNYLRFARLTSTTKTASGLIGDLQTEQLRIDVIDADLVRIKISRGGVFDEKPTFALAAEPELGKTTFNVRAGANSTSLITDLLEVRLSHEPFSIDVYRADGSVVFESVRDERGTWAYGTLNDGFVIRRKVGAADPIYGLGEKTGAFNRRGRDFTLWNTDVLNPTASGEFAAQYDPSDLRADNTSTEFDPYYVSIPFFYHQDAVTSRISGSFIDNGYRGFYDFTSADEFKIHFGGGQYTEYVFAGPSMPRILEQYTALTGRTALPPLWSLGFHQCRWFGYNQSDVERLVAKYREVDVPLDTFWLDIDYMDGYRVFTWNKERYPDATAMLKRLKAQGVRVITIIDPGVKLDPGYEVYDDGLKNQVFAITEGGDTYIGQVWPGDTAFPDFANEKARAWWGQLNAEHVKSGLAGIWNDMNEPATGEIDPMRMRFDRGQFSHERFHNQYAMLMAMGTTEGLLKAMPELRTFVLSRAGSAGIQRYAANWMGDNMSRWDHLWLSIPMGAGLSISGQSFVGADIGGFAEDTNPELYTRWIQCGALTPFARVHSVINTIDQYVWSFGEEV
ncbi:MAG: TIM-barrel domain-containing protein, partial [Micrococcales bacterium]